jgi:beta-glucosidase
MSKDQIHDHGVDIEALLNQLTLEEQVALLTGADFWTTAPIERLGIPRVKVTDGPNGARGGGGLTNGTKSAAFPCAIALGATWNPDFIYETGEALAAEARAKGARILLAPTVNMHRSGLNGRNFECYSEDPCLTSEIAVAYIKGLQDNGVGATIKHFIGNDSEIQRETISSDVDERTLREIYLPPFEAAVKKAGVWAVMTSYNRVNGTYASDHKWLMTDVMRQEFGFDGVFVSDWFGTKSTVESINAGHDLEMPGPTRVRGTKLLEAVQNGSVERATIKAAAGRVLALLKRVGAFDSEGPEIEQAVERAEVRALIRKLGADAAVLLKNDSILPLSNGVTVAAIGPNAATARIMGGGSAQINAHRKISPVDGLCEALGAQNVAHAKGTDNNRLVQVLEGDLTVSIFRGRKWEGEPALQTTEVAANLFWIDLPIADFDDNDFSVRVEGTFTPQESGQYRFGMTNAGFARAYLDGEEIIDGVTGWAKGVNFFGIGNDEIRAERTLEAGRTYAVVIKFFSPDHPEEGTTFRALHFGVQKPTDDVDIVHAVNVAKQQDVAILFVGRQGEWDSEGADLPDMKLPGDQVKLIEAVAAANSNTIVALQTGGPVEMPWLDKVKAVVQFWYPGQEAGHAMVDVLLGKAVPGGRLPQTFPLKMQDNSAWGDSPLSYPGQDGHVRYSEGIFVGYRHHDRRGVPTLFPFGFGLGYTNFVWGQLEISANEVGQDGISLRLPVTNVGEREGAEVVQLYVKPIAPKVERPMKELRAFAKLHLQAGETKVATLKVTPRDLGWYDVDRKSFVSDAGAYELVLAANTEDIRAATVVTLAEEWIETR